MEGPYGMRSAPRVSAHSDREVVMGESRERFQEGLEIITRAWTQETFSYAGKFHTFRTVMVLPRPVQRPMPPFPAAVAVPPAIQHPEGAGRALPAGPAPGRALARGRGDCRGLP